MFVFPLLFLIPSNHGKRCYNLGSEKNDQKLHAVMSGNKTVGESSLKLTFYNFDNRTDKISFNSTTSRIAFNISVVRHISMIPSLGVPFGFSVRDGSYKPYECFEPVDVESSYFQFLKNEVRGTTLNSKDFFIRAHKSSQFCGTQSDKSVMTTSQGFTTSSPDSYLEVSVFLSVKVIESLEIQIDSISDDVFKVSVSNLKSKENIAPHLSCFVNGMNVTGSPQFRISSKLNESSQNRFSSPYKKEENEARAANVKLVCWSEAYKGPLVCSAIMSGITYWSNTVYLTRGSDMGDCKLNSNLTVTDIKEKSRLTRLGWSCDKDESSYTVHVNETVSMHNYSPCTLRIQTQNTSSCSVETDQLEQGMLYKVWVTTSTGKLMVDVTDVLIPRKVQSDVEKVLVWVLAGCGLVIIGLVGFLVLTCKLRAREEGRESEVQKLNKGDLDGYESNDVVIIHITNSEFSEQAD
ncbi:hypothetical protein ACHWQZ_G003426 [Mnemiopsis leidyi]